MLQFMRHMNSYTVLCFRTKSKRENPRAAPASFRSRYFWDAVVIQGARSPRIHTSRHERDKRGVMMRYSALWAAAVPFYPGYSYLMVPCFSRQRALGDWLTLGDSFTVPDWLRLKLSHGRPP